MSPLQCGLDNMGGYKKNPASLPGFFVHVGLTGRTTPVRPSHSRVAASRRAAPGADASRAVPWSSDGPGRSDGGCAGAEPHAAEAGAPDAPDAAPQ